MMMGPEGSGTGLQKTGVFGLSDAVRKFVVGISYFCEISNAYISETFKTRGIRFKKSKIQPVKLSLKKLYTNPFAKTSRTHSETIKMYTTEPPMYEWARVPDTR